MRHPGQNPCARRRARRAWAAACVAALSIGAAAAAETRTTFVETFDGGGNAGAWTFGTGYETVVGEGGNPGACVRDARLSTFTPRASTSWGVTSEFTGDYRARGVVSVGIDLAIAAVNGGVAGRTVTLILLNDNGTPADLEDDWGAYTVTTLPVPPTGVIGVAPLADMLSWASYDIPVPSQQGALPDGWTFLSRNSVRPGGAWARLMRDVDHVGFILGDPALLYPLFSWDVALDNPRITTVR